MPKKRSKSRSKRTYQVKRTSKDSQKKLNKSGRVDSKKRKVKIILKNLILFAVLFVLSVILKNIFTDEILVNFFWILALVTGFITVAFVITYLVLFFSILFKKK